MKDINSMSFSEKALWGKGKTVFRVKEFREFVLGLWNEGCTYKEITEKVKEKWPDKPEYHVSIQSIHRFFKRCRENSGVLTEPSISRTNEGNYPFLIYNLLQEMANTLIDIRDAIEREQDWSGLRVVNPIIPPDGGDKK